MKLLKLIRLFYYIRLNWLYLPNGLQDDLVDTLEDYICMIRISKLERRKNGI